jgi:hypothetical protein
MSAKIIRPSNFGSALPLVFETTRRVDGVRVHLDFGKWTAAHYEGARFVRNASFEDREDAEAYAQKLASTGRVRVLDGRP